MKVSALIGGNRFVEGCRKFGLVFLLTQIQEIRQCLKNSRGTYPCFRLGRRAFEIPHPGPQRDASYFRCHCTGLFKSEGIVMYCILIL